MDGDGNSTSERVRSDPIPVASSKPAGQVAEDGLAKSSPSTRSVGASDSPRQKPQIAAKPSKDKCPPQKPQKPPRDSRIRSPRPSLPSLPGDKSPSTPPRQAPPPPPSQASSKRPSMASSLPKDSPQSSSPVLPTVSDRQASESLPDSSNATPEPQNTDATTTTKRRPSSRSSSPVKTYGRSTADDQRVSSPSSAGSVLSSDSEDENIECNQEKAWYGVVNISQIKTAEVVDEHEEDDTQSEMTEEEKKKFKLFKIAEELMKTEETYVNGLELLVMDLRTTLEEAHQEGKCKVEPDTMKKIFSILPEIYGIHHKMLIELKERLGQWENNQRIGDIMLSFAPFLKVYANFTMNFEQAIQTITDLSKNDKKFHAVIKNFEAQPKCRLLGIAHFMLEPVQRIPRYKLLLLDYIKRLPEESEDRPDTEKALDLVSIAADHANGMFQELENFSKVMMVQTSLVDKGNFAQPGRSLVKHGVLMKSSRKSFQQRHFFLFNDTLLHCAPVNGSPFGEGGLYKIRDQLPVFDLSLEEPMVSPLPNSFMVISVHRSICLAANSDDEKKEWMQSINDCIEQAKLKIQNMHRNSGLEKDGSNSQQLGVVAPVWVHDQSTSMCMDCALAFTVLRRRHHCRCCGKVVCASCSNNMSYLEYCKKKERVCDSCYLKLGGTLVKKQKRPKKEGPGVREIKGYDKDSDLTGYLHLKSGWGWKRYWFQVKDLALFWFKAPEDLVAVGNQPLPGMTLTALKKGQEGADREYSFKVFHKSLATIIVSAESEEEQQRWMKVLEDAIAGNL